MTKESLEEVFAIDSLSTKHSIPYLPDLVYEILRSIVARDSAY